MDCSTAYSLSIATSARSNNLMNGSLLGIHGLASGSWTEHHGEEEDEVDGRDYSGDLMVIDENYRQWNL